MVTRNKLLSYVNARKEIEKRDPIFQIFLFEHPDKELVYDSGKASGFPDLGAAADMGFFYELDHAIAAMEENAADIRETVYDAGFILCHFPGLYESASSGARMYFVWDDEKEGFYQKEEPKIFRHVAY